MTTRWPSLFYVCQDGVNRQAVESLTALLRSLENGVSLFILVMKQSRITKPVVDKYHLFVKFVSKNQVPVVLVKTGCEMDENPGEWLQTNKAALDAYG